MKIWNSLREAHEETVKLNIKTILTIGNFDGVHRGHQILMKRLLELKHIYSGLAVALIFVNHTESVLRDKPLLLNTLPEQRELLTSQGLDAIVEIEFNSLLAQMSAADFFKVWIVEGLQTKALVVGHDFHFGAGGQGDFKLLQTLAAPHQIHLEQIPPICESGETISSSKIRELLTHGEIELANRMLGYSFTIRGQVTTGEQRGRKLGYPTANIHVPSQYVLPRYGVYLIKLKVADEIYFGIANVGIKPTFNGLTPLIEVYLFDVRLNLYQKMVSVEFLHFIRPEFRFPGPEALKAQIVTDIGQAKKILEDKPDA